ncbi:hypothetical protein ACFV0O_00265 [Kitasatospora sp. NPDC059577]|uniref:hypothetical protein n=1 Tax=Kitasatospora sp. NPDC059577 TaxID=3346873 RepID=UPI00367CD754
MVGDGGLDLGGEAGGGLGGGGAAGEVGDDRLGRLPVGGSQVDKGLLGGVSLLLVASGLVPVGDGDHDEDGGGQQGGGGGAVVAGAGGVQELLGGGAEGCGLLVFDTDLGSGGAVERGCGGS